MILLLSSNSTIKVRKFLDLFDIFLFYDRPFLYVCNLEVNLLFSTVILGSVFSNYVGDALVAIGNGMQAVKQLQLLTEEAADRLTHVDLDNNCNKSVCMCTSTSCICL